MYKWKVNPSPDQYSEIPGRREEKVRTAEIGGRDKSIWEEKKKKSRT